MIWELNRIENVFLKTNYGELSKLKESLKQTLNYYESVKIKNSELDNRITILKTLINKYKNER